MRSVVSKFEYLSVQCRSKSHLKYDYRPRMREGNDFILSMCLSVYVYVCSGYNVLNTLTQKLHFGMVEHLDHT